ncbi:DegT/DnrJ/EryC1/StrS family aminotransferase [Nanoarchaeota archaeon]
MKDSLKELTGHKNLVLTDSGDSAIEKAFGIAKKQGRALLIADQGGWFSYKKLPKKLDLEVREIKTDYGLVDFNSLKKEKDCALILTSFAGYFAEQDTEEISSICKQNNILFIEDITGIIGYKKIYGDIAVCSFAKWKPINFGSGGFISSNQELDFEDEFDFDEKLADKIKDLPNRYKLFFENVEKIKKDLSDFEILHKDKKGLNVVVKFSSEEEKSEIIKYCEKNNYEWVLCPNYVKVNTDAISIEVKRIGN